jgi:SOS-response transcriptional repressor LexA
MTSTERTGRTAITVFMTDAANRLRKLREAKGYEGPAEAARAFGWSENTYKSHENGLRGIRPDVAQKYARAFGSTAAFILTGDTGAPSLSPISEVGTVSVLGEVAAGMFRAGNWTPEDDAEIPALPRKGIPASKQYAVRVDGPSVNRRIPDGMYAICAMFDAYPGGATMGSLVHVTRQDGELVEHTIKELRLTPQGMMLMPVSDDPAYQEAVALASSEESVVEIRGVVIGVFQPI